MALSFKQTKGKAVTNKVETYEFYHVIFTGLKALITKTFLSNVWLLVAKKKNLII
jgi:hypothetical protein